MNNRTNQIGAIGFPADYRSALEFLANELQFRLLNIIDDGDAPGCVLLVGESPKFETWDHKGDLPEYSLRWTDDGKVHICRADHQQSKGIH